MLFSFLLLSALPMAALVAAAPCAGHGLKITIAELGGDDELDGDHEGHAPIPAPAPASVAAASAPAALPMFPEDAPATAAPQAASTTAAAAIPVVTAMTTAVVIQSVTSIVSLQAQTPALTISPTSSPILTTAITTSKFPLQLTTAMTTTMSQVQPSQATAGGLIPVGILPAAPPSDDAPMEEGNSAANACQTGHTHCCSAVHPAGSDAVSSLLGLLNVPIGDSALPVGVNCTPLGVLGLGSGSCNSQPVCCQNNTYDGVVALGCMPINLGL